MTKARDLANAGTALGAVSATELGYVDGVTSAIQTQLDAKTAKSTLTTTGDIYYASAANTPARLGIGSSAQVLTVASGIPSWAAASSGGMTLISTTTLTGASVTLSSIPQTYKHLQLVIRNFKPATDNQYLNIRINGDSGTRYFGTIAGGQGNAFDQTAMRVLTEQNDNSVATGLTIIDFPDYTNTTTWKMCNAKALAVNATTTTSNNYGAMNALYNQIDAVSSLTLLCESGNMTSGTALLYGVS